MFSLRKTQAVPTKLDFRTFGRTHTGACFVFYNLVLYHHESSEMFRKARHPDTKKVHLLVGLVGLDCAVSAPAMNFWDRGGCKVHQNIGSGTPIPISSFPYHSHTSRESYGSSMGDWGSHVLGGPWNFPGKHSQISESVSQTYDIGDYHVMSSFCEPARIF